MRTWAGMAGAALALVALLLAPAWLRPGRLQALDLWVVMTMAAVGLNLTVGYARQVSLAQGAFVGIGAYATALLTARGWSFPSSVAASSLACFAVAVPLGYWTLRAHRHGLAIATLAFAVLFHLVLVNEEWLTGGTAGIAGLGRADGIVSDAGRLHGFAVAALVLATAIVWWIARSPWGRALQAVRENPARAEALGVDTRRYALASFAIAAAIGGMAGAFYAPLVRHVEPSQFTAAFSIKLLLIVVLGGGGHLFGPFVGALLALLLTEWLHLGDEAALIVYALAAMAVLAFRPEGLAGIVARLRPVAPAEPAP